MPSPNVVGLDGITREWNSVFGTDRAHAHGLDREVGYVVRTTFFGGAPHVDSAEFDAGAYGDAIALAHSIRSNSHHPGYAVVDRVYACGCRHNG